MAEAFSLQNRFISCVFQASGGELGERGAEQYFLVVLFSTMSRKGTQLRIKMKKTFPSFEVDFGI